jgi:hypothetical protein
VRPRAPAEDVVSGPVIDDSLDGSGVIIALIDGGFDLRNQDLQTTTG